MFIERQLQGAITQALESFPAVMITGPRQSGKTRLLREKWGNTFHFFSLEDPETRALLREDPKGFFNRQNPPLILDEIQYQPDMLPYLKSYIDMHRDQTGQWLLTGSQQFSLMKGVSESLAGRTAIFNLLPLSLAEIQGRQANILSFLLEHQIPQMEGNNISLGAWLLRGSYPELYEKPQMDRRFWYGAYLQTYLERDVRNLTQVGDLGDFEKFLKLLAARTGQELNLHEVTKEVGVSLPTGKRWLSMLESSFVVYLLRPYYRNFGKRLIKSPKIYFIDVGLASFLVGLYTEEHLLASSMSGHLFETAIVSEFVKGYYNKGLLPPLYFWRSHDGVEMDLLVEDNLRLIPIEIKQSATLSPEHLQGIRKWLQVTGMMGTKAILICSGMKVQEVNNDITVYPWRLV